MIPLDFTFRPGIWRSFPLRNTVFSRSGLGIDHHHNHNHHVTLIIVLICDSFCPREKTSCSTAVSRSRRVRGALVFTPVNHGKLPMDAAWRVQVVMPLMMMLMVLLLPPPLLLLLAAAAAAADTIMATHRRCCGGLFSSNSLQRLPNAIAHLRCLF